MDGQLRQLVRTRAAAVGRTTAWLLDMNDPERRRVRELVARIQS